MNIEPEINAWLGLFAWHAGAFWERPEEEWGETVRDGTERGQTCRLIRRCVDRQRACPWDAIFDIVAPSQTGFACPHTFHTKKGLIAVGHL